ncbi:MAG: hypothetical protein IJP65_10080 [Bacteroidales bacterium]|nr:hypothetical protein [Bacteroidales bacterium]MBR0055630.1 hypothetical protein [Bacteroidales bacterium]
MKRFILCTFALTLSLLSLQAQSVTPEEAASVAAAFLQSQGKRYHSDRHNPLRYRVLRHRPNGHHWNFLLHTRQYPNIPQPDTDNINSKSDNQRGHH